MSSVSLSNSFGTIIQDCGISAEDLNDLISRVEVMKEKMGINLPIELAPSAVWETGRDLFASKSTLYFPRGYPKGEYQIDQVAADGLIAHELAHIKLKHINQNTLISMFSLPICFYITMELNKHYEFGPREIASIILVSSVSLAFISAKFSRMKESAADDEASRYLTDNQSQAFSEWFRSKRRTRSTSILLRLLSSHPSDESRIEKFENSIRDPLNQEH